MNSHYHPYADMSSPHPPSPDNNNYASPMGMGAGGNHHNGHGPMMNSIGGQQQGFHQLNNNNTMMNKCAGCGTKIAERYLLSAIDKFWHHTCLKCSCCGATLADLGGTCFTKGNMILCKADYSRLFAPPCSACSQTIAPNELVMRTTTQSGNQQAPNPPSQSIQHHVFHLKCFSCSKCAAPLRQGDRYYMLAGSLVCEQDYHKLLKTSSAGNTNTPPVRKGKVGRPRRSRD